MKKGVVVVAAVLLLAAGVSIGVLLWRPWPSPPVRNTAAGASEPVAVDPGGLPQLFRSDSQSDSQSDAMGFSIRYPSGWTVDTTYRYQALGPGKDITGVSFTIPASRAEGSNLSAGSYLSVEEIARTDRCTANLFLPRGTAASDETLDGTAYSVGHRTDAAMGNRYDETVYAIPDTYPCLAVRYFIHWTVIENYPPGARTAFDRHSLLERLDVMRRTLVIVR